MCSDLAILHPLQAHSAILGSVTLGLELYKLHFQDPMLPGSLSISANIKS